MRHTEDVTEAVRSFVDKTTNHGEHPHGLDYEVVIVACSYVLGNEKYWVTTNIPDGKYYEVTYNDSKNEMYLDVYVKVHNETREV